MISTLFATLHDQWATYSRPGSALGHISNIAIVDAPLLLSGPGLQSGISGVYIRMPGRTGRSIALS